jgi:hypothetical protein
MHGLTPGPKAGIGGGSTEQRSRALSPRDMHRLAIALVILVVGGCSGDSDDFDVPLVCGPEHTQSPCASGVEEGVDYRFNLLTHCGIEWAYFDGRYWIPKPKVDPPGDWAAIEGGSMTLDAPDVALFEADEGGGARFVPAPRSYRPPTCA